MKNREDSIYNRSRAKNLIRILGVTGFLIIIGYVGLIRQAFQVRGETATAGENAGLWYSPHEIDFGDVGVGTLSEQRVVTITNVGATTIYFAGGAAQAPFSATQNCAGGLTPGASCQYFYRFSPTETGEFSTTTGPGSDAGPIQVNLRGSGAGPDFTYTPRSLDFGRVHNGTLSDIQPVTIKNTGLATLTFAGGAAPAPFSATQNCAGGVAPGDSCQYFYRFAPTASGLYTTTTGPSTNADKAVTVDLSGRGYSGPFVPIYNFYVSPLELDFGPVGVSTASASQEVYIRNNSLTETLTNFAGGGVSSPFSAAQNCAGGVPPGDFCQYFFSFSPTSSGVFSTTSNSSTNMGSFTILLRGEGKGASLSFSPPSLDFGPVPLGNTSASQSVIIKNIGLSTLTNFAGGGVSAPFSAAQNCASGVPPGSSCQYFFTYSPTAPGHYNATSNSSTNAGPITIKLSGGMHPPEISQQFSPSIITPGEASTLELVINNPNENLALSNVSVNNVFPSGLQVAAPPSSSVSAECGTPSFNPTAGGTALSFSGGTISAGDTCQIKVSVTAGQAGTYINSTNAVGAANPAGTGNTSTATLIVSYRQYLPIIQR